jgi:hypothetical protein
MTGESVATEKFRLATIAAGEGKDERSAVCEGVDEAFAVFGVGGID